MSRSELPPPGARVDDASYKLLFSSPELVRDLVLGFIPDEWLHSLDYSTLEKVPGSYVTDDLRHRADDVVWRVRTGEDWVYLYLLIEFQSKPDRWMAVRMMTYLGLLYQDLIRRGELVPGREANGISAPAETFSPAGTSAQSRAAAPHRPADGTQAREHQQQQPRATDMDGPKAGKRLPPVLPIVLYNGSAQWTAATDIAELLPRAPGLVAEYLPRLKYLLLDQRELAKGLDLSRLRNLVAAVVRLEHPENLQAIIPLVDELNELLDNQPELKRTFAIWIRALLLRRHNAAWILPKADDLKELRMGLAEQMERFKQEMRQEGLAQGIAEGHAKGHAEGAQQAQTLILQRLLSRRFGELPPHTLQRIQQATPQQLETWIDQVLDADSLATVFADG
ncbi:MAG: Rpn family recombination-promoting nuclease/putative transposase [Lautropia sp.]|nr:Rpn family recombination-promoting nuclease/putative transposase [Lautropia sp.]